ncbi:hypothetical protein [Lutispora sp.]|uniref:hypothetical protein n=1 Tax=Lutispora sp. TaxID=2828727 RepID=UPI002B201B59|nr:hypothetical protein [Lutispora sp.]MEA4960214.1 hypothetical protein [Lutispora sp.]
MKKSTLYIICILLVFSLVLGACGRTVNKAGEDHEIKEAGKINETEAQKAQDVQKEDENDITEPEPNEVQEAKKDYPLIIKDMLGNNVKIAKKPEKIAVISGKLFELFYSAGGESICRVETEGGKPSCENMKSLPTVGKESNPDIIEILELEPDLVIVEAGSQNAIASDLKKNEIIVIALETGNESKDKKAVKIMKEAAGID